ncbi:MAG: branched-chain amino acid ABC transporter permease [Thermoprotei archaeon]
MVLSTLSSFFVLGLTLGVVYVLLSEGFSLLYGVAGVLNGAYGALYMITDYIVFVLLVHLRLGAPLSILISLVFLALVAGFIQRYIIGRGKGALESLFVTLALAFVIQYLVQFVQCSSAFRAFCQYPAYVPVFIQGSTNILGVSVFNQYIVADAVSVGILVGVWVMLTRTRLGRSIRAVSQDGLAAALVGINPTRMVVLTSMLAAIMAGASSVFLASYQTVDPTIGWSVLTLAFAIVVVGGLGSLIGTVIAAFIFAFMDTYVLLYVNPLLAGFAAVALLIIVLLIRPQGLFGRGVQ